MANVDLTHEDLTLAMRALDAEADRLRDNSTEAEIELADMTAKLAPETRRKICRRIAENSYHLGKVMSLMERMRMDRDRKEPKE